MSAATVWLRALPALLTLELLGSGLVLLLWRGPHRISWGEWAAWSWLAGVGAGSVLLGLLGLMLPGSWLFPVLALLSLGVAWGGWWKAGGRAAIQAWPVAGASWEKALALLPAVLVAFAFAWTLQERLLADGLFMWEFKARVGFLAGGHLPLQIFTDATRVTCHPRYPLLLPLTELWVYLGAGAADQPLLKTLFPPFYAAAALLLYAMVARVTGRLWIAALAAFLPAAVPELLLHSFTLFRGYADYPLATLYFAAVTGLVLPAPGGRLGGQWPLGALAAALLPWTKAEGVLLWGLWSGALLLLPGPGRWRRAWAGVLPGALVWFVWAAVLALVQAQREEVFAPLNAASLALAGQRFWPVLGYFAQEAIQLDRWGLLWLALPGVFLVSWWSPQRSRLLLAFGLAAGPLALDVLPYLFTRLDLGFHLQTSCNRLFSQAAWVGVLALALCWPGSLAESRPAAEAPDTPA